MAGGPIAKRNGQTTKATNNSNSCPNRVENGGSQGLTHQSIGKNGQPEWVGAADEAQREAAPMQTFERMKFQELMDQYEGVQGKVQSTIELS